MLDIDGAFSLRNALRRIGPGEKQTLVLAFSPSLERKVANRSWITSNYLFSLFQRDNFNIVNTDRCFNHLPPAVLQYCETLEVRCQKMTLKVTLCGKGVVPAVTSSHPGGLLDFGYVLEKESTSQVLKVSLQCVAGRRKARRCPSRWCCRHFVFFPCQQVQDWKSVLTTNMHWLTWCIEGDCGIETDIKAVLQLQNNSALAVSFRVQLESLCSSRPQVEADTVALLLGGYVDSQVQPAVGKTLNTVTTHNLNC